MRRFQKIKYPSIVEVMMGKSIVIPWLDHGIQVIKKHAATPRHIDLDHTVKPYDGKEHLQPTTNNQPLKKRPVGRF